MSAQPKKPARRRQRFALRVVKGGWAPADASTAAQLRGKHRVGDLVFAEFVKPRNPGFHRLAHQLGGMLAENIEAFSAMSAHNVLKRLQIEADIGCDHMMILIQDVGPCEYRMPRSLSFESMDESEFHDCISAMCGYISRKYWKSCTPEQIEAMASIWVDQT